MAGPFAPVIAEPGTANVQPVQTTLARPAKAANSLLADVVGAVGEGFDIFAKFKKESTNAAIDDEIEKLEQANVDQLIDGNIRSVVGSDTREDDPDEALPTEAQGELERLERLREGVKQGVVSNDKFLLDMVAGVRKIKAMFPGHIGVIDSRMVKKLGFRPTTAIVERALAPEKAREARVAQFKDTAFKTGSFAMRADGTVGPFLNDDGTVNEESTVRNGAKIIFAVNEAEALRNANAAKAAALAASAASASASSDIRKRALELDADTSNDIKKGFDSAVEGMIGPQMEASLQGLRRLGPNATPQEKEQAMQAVANTIRQTLDGLRDEYNWSFLNAKTREDAMTYITERTKALMDPFTNKDTGLMFSNARLMTETTAATKFQLSKFPKLWAFNQMGSFGAELVKTKMFMDTKMFASLLDDVGQLGQTMDESDVATVTKKLMSDPDAIESLTPAEALIGLKILRKSTAAWARNKSLPMDERSATGYFNSMHNLAKSAATLPTAKDKLEAASFFSDQSQVQRVAELATIDEDAAKVIGTDAIYVINEGIAATGRELANRPGFGDTWTVEFDSSVGSFVARMTNGIPGLPVGGEEAVPLGGPATGIGEFIATRNIRDTILAQMDEATDIMIDMNSGLRAVEAYAPLDESLSGLDRLQVREAVAASAFLANVEGTLSNFKTAQKKAAIQVKVVQRFANVREALVGGLRSLRRATNAQDRAVLKALQNQGAPSETKVIRRRYDTATGTFKPAE